MISLVVQGFTLAPLVRLAGLGGPAGDSDGEYASAQRRLAQATLACVEELDAVEAIAPVVLERIRRSLKGTIADEQGEIARTYRQVRRDVVRVQR